jgi:hypothetical protein
MELVQTSCEGTRGGSRTRERSRGTIRFVSWRHRLVALLLGLAGAGCGQPRESVTGPPCDREALATHAAWLQEAERAWTPSSGLVPDNARATAGAVWRACPGLPGPSRVILDRSVRHDMVRDSSGKQIDTLAGELPGHAALDDRIGVFAAERGAMNAEVCADLEKIVTRAKAQEIPTVERAGMIFDACDLQRFGLLSRDEVVRNRDVDPIGFFLLQHWLVGRGEISPEVARVLVRELLVDPNEPRPRPEQRLPYASSEGDPLHEEGLEVLFVGPEAIYLGREPLLRLADGAIPSGSLSRAGTPPQFWALGQHVILMCDRGVPWSTLLEVVSLFQDVDLMFVRPQFPRYLGAVRIGSAEFGRPPVFKIHLSAHEARVHCERTVTPVADDAALEAAVEKCPWVMTDPIVVEADANAPAERVAFARQMAEKYPEMLGSMDRKQPRDAPSRINVRLQAGEIVVTCHDETRTLREVEALAAELTRCHGPESSYLDLSAAPDTPLQRVVDVALAGRRAGKRVGLESDR